MKKEKPEGKTRYQMIIDGEIEPEGSEKGYINLREGQTTYNINNLSPEKRKEFCRKGAEAVRKLHGEKKTAQQALENILTLKVTDDIYEASDAPPEVIDRLKRDNPEATIYDLLQAVAVGRAVRGSMAAMQYVRDTNGDKPQDKIQIDGGSIMTDADREMLQAIRQRMEAGERLEVVKDV